MIIKITASVLTTILTVTTAAAQSSAPVVTLNGTSWFRASPCENMTSSS